MCWLLRAFALTLASSTALTSCGDTLEAEPSAQAAQDTASALAQHMVDHFGYAIAVRDALIDGDLEGMREPARWLADHPSAPGLPAGAESYLEGMRVAAKLAAEARDFGSAARAVASLARVCGSCHQAFEVEIQIADDEPPDDEDDAITHMIRHVWAADRMWEGLIGPSHEAWMRGATTLGEAPLQPSDISDAWDLYPRMAALARRVHTLAAEGRDVTDAIGRSEIYGGFLAACARCHRLVDDWARAVGAR